jgi:GTP-binding protein LepA
MGSRTSKTIRNFSIVAHIDHGKSTLADRVLEHTGALSKNEMEAQVLDTMDLERERGITIKAHTVRLNYKAKDGRDYVLNLIDTPGHVDFSYEVSRSLASCEGALLVVDASQGIEAQSLANAYLAIENNLKIIPVINKIDLPSADPEKVKKQIAETLPIDPADSILASAKEDIGTEDVLEAVVKKLPPPSGDDLKPLKALLFDSWFDPYRGSIVLVRVFDGTVRPGMKIRLMSTGKDYEVAETGVFTPKMKTVPELRAGEVGYVVAGIKDISDTKIGDTMTGAQNPSGEPCPGYKEIKPMVFCGLYPTESGQYETLKDAFHKLRLNDSSFDFEPESSAALGFGFRCGFLGLLHMEIIRERLEREFGLSLISTTPTVSYKATSRKGSIRMIHNPAGWEGGYEKVEEPFVRKIMLQYEMPLGEIIWDFYDKLKSISRGYASMDYEPTGYREADLVKLDILINGDPVDALSLIVHRDKAYRKGRQMVDGLKEIIPRQLYEVVIQAAIGGRALARQTVKAMRKDVIAKLYGGDVTRKRKLLEKQKEGKKRMKQVGKVEIPQEAFLTVMKVTG